MRNLSSQPTQQQQKDVYKMALVADPYTEYVLNRLSPLAQASFP